MKYLCLFKVRPSLLRRCIYGYLFGPLAEWADKLTELGRGKHHLGDFLPPEELEKFMETYTVSISGPYCFQKINTSLETINNLGTQLERDGGSQPKCL